jgi:hypothetical protein
MQHKKDPGYGSTKCHGCLLCPQRDEFGIHKFIAREPERKEGQEYTQSYPCPVINRYECPHEKDVNKLFAIQEIADAIHVSFLRAYVITQGE